MTSFKEEFVAKVRQAIEAAKDIEEPYRGFAFMIYLAHELGVNTISPRLPTTATPAQTPKELLAKLKEISNRDLIGFMLYYEGAQMTKQEMMAKSVELGKPLPENWVDRKFAESTRGLVAPVETEQGKAYKLSGQGRIEVESRLKELLPPQ